MDLVEYWRVLRRRSRIVFVGMGVTLLLVTGMVMRVSSDGVSLRSTPLYGARSTLFVTQSGFPWGRSALADYVRARGTDDESVVPRFADPGRLEYLASLYTQLAATDPVRKAVERGSGSVKRPYSVTQLMGPGGRTLPLVEVLGMGSTREEAVATSNRAATALRRYVVEGQEESKVPQDTRVTLPIVTKAQTAVLIKGWSPTTSIMIFLLGAVATLVLAFAVDNVKRNRRALEADGDEQRMPESLVQIPRSPVVPRERTATSGDALASELERPVAALSSSRHASPERKGAPSSARWRQGSG